MTDEPTASVDASDFPQLRTGPVEVPIPYVTITEPAANFANDQNATTQLNAWIGRLKYTEIVQLLQKLYEYGHGSLYAFMLAWCRGGEGFDPLEGCDATDWEQSTCWKLELLPQERSGGVAMWRCLQKRSATRSVDLRRVLHFLLFLYSNDRLTTRSTGSNKDSPGAPGQLVQKMTQLLLELAKNGPEAAAVAAVEARRHGSYKDPIIFGKCAALLGQSGEFRTVAPGWMEYMSGNLGSLRQALRFPPFDDRADKERLYEELFVKGIGMTDAQRERQFLQVLGENVEPDKPGAALDADEHVCIVCMSGPRKIVFMPCCHFVVCKLCADQVSACPSCKGPLVGKLEVFF